MPASGLMLLIACKKTAVLKLNNREKPTPVTIDKTGL